MDKTTRVTQKNQTVVWKPNLDTLVFTSNPLSWTSRQRVFVCWERLTLSLSLFNFASLWPIWSFSKNGHRNPPRRSRLSYQLPLLLQLLAERSQVEQVFSIKQIGKKKGVADLANLKVSLHGGQIMHFIFGFSIINHPYWGSPIWEDRDCMSLIRPNEHLGAKRGSCHS